MSQAPLIHFITGKKKFVIRHVFKDVKNMKDDDKMEGPIEYHHSIPWRIRVCRADEHFDFFLDCLFEEDNTVWMVAAVVAGKTTQGLEIEGFKKMEYIYRDIPEFHVISWPMCTIHQNQSKYFINDKDIGYELNVTIVEAIKKKVPETLINFGDEAAKEVSDVTLIVKDEKFHVLKKDIDPNDFHYYLEFLYAESSIREHSVLAILRVADFSDSKTVVRRCQEFLVEQSELPLYLKFQTAIKFNLEELKTKCISEMNSAADIESIVPKNSGDFNTDVWKELLKKSISMIPK